MSNPGIDPDRRREAADVVKAPVVQRALAKVHVGRNPSGDALLALDAGSLASFVILRAAQALDMPRPMRRCVWCGSWSRSAAPGARLAFVPRPASTFTIDRGNQSMASVRRIACAAERSAGRPCRSSPGPGRKPRQRTKNFGREKDARDANQMEVEIERKGVGDPDRHTVERYLRRWLARLADRGEHSPTTLQSYRRNIDLACRYIGHIPLEKLSPADLDQLYATLLKRAGECGRRTRTAAAMSAGLTREPCCTYTASCTPLSDKRASGG